MSYPSPSKPFTKGDPRINPKGRPRNFDALRELAQQIAHEEALSGGQPVVINGHVVTVAEAIMRSWAASKNPQFQKAFIEHYLGISLANLIGTLNIQKIVLTGDMTRFGSAWLDAVNESMRNAALSRLSENTLLDLGRLDYRACILGASGS